MLDLKNIYEELNKVISENSIVVNTSMKEYTSFKVGGTADILVTARTIDDVKNVLKICKKYNCPLFVLGNGTNILVKDNGIRGIVLRNRLEEFKILEDNTDNYMDIIVGSGVKNAILAQKLLNLELSGFEFASGIPGTIGGAIKMNAGAYGGEIKDIIIEATYIDFDGNVHTLTNNEMKLAYRSSIFKETQGIIVSAKLRFSKGSKDLIKEKMNQNEKSRKEKQPVEFPSAGSTFKRGEDFITAQLIDECGLKGYKIGGAEVSTKHAGFVINTGNATAEDIINLTDLIKEKVKEKFDKDINLEIEIVGE